MAREQQAAARRKKQLGGKIILGVLLCMLSFALLLALYTFDVASWSSFNDKLILDAKQALIVYDSAGEEVSVLYDSSKNIRIPISLAEVPERVRYAFLAAEDARFYEHIGVDFIRIAGAAWEDIKAGAYVQGASTISQQLVKLSHLSPEKKLARKLEEAVLAYQMEQQYNKNEILEMYLNYVYFGSGYYGIEAAARGYFGVHARELTTAQGAQLAGILKGPSNYAPHLNMEKSLRRRNLILDEMLEYGFISQEEHAAARLEQPVLTNSMPLGQRGYYIDLALEQACEALAIPMDTLLSGGYRIHTAMERDAQACVDALMQDETMFPENTPEVQAAAVVINAKTGGVVALSGGRNEDTPRAFNRAVQIRRQPGSVIKPILVYAPALEEYRYTAVTMLLDEPTDFNGYLPENFNKTYNGWVTLRRAVQSSLNIPAVKVLESIGLSTGMDFARRLGIEFDARDNSLALALGGFTYGVSPYQIANAYAAFSAGGEYAEATLVYAVTDSKGTELYRYAHETERVMSEANAYILTNMLESAVKNGTGRKLSDLGIALAGKTGTTGAENSNRDAWMAAYNPEYAAAVWMGCDTAADGNALPNEATGGTYPAMMLRSVFQTLYQNREAPEFVLPEGVKEYRLDGYTLDNAYTPVLATAFTPEEHIVREVFVAGTEPKNVSDYWVVPLPPNDLLASYNNGVVTVSFTPVNDFILYRLYRTDRAGRTEQLGEWPGGSLRIVHQDDTAVHGELYEYYVLPVHPQMTVGGKQVTGAASSKYRLDMPEEALFTRLGEIKE